MEASETQTELPPEQVAGGDPQDAQIVDVRTAEEREASRIPDSLHIPIEELNQRTDELDRDRPVVFYCRSGERSNAAAEAFAASGWQAHSIDGGLVAWVDQGLPLEPEGAEVGSRTQLPPR